MIGLRRLLDVVRFFVGFFVLRVRFMPLS